MRRAPATAVALIAAAALAGCGGDDDPTDRAATAPTTTAEQPGGAALDRVQRVVPEAQTTDPAALAASGGADQIDAFMQDVIRNIDGYWSRTFAEADLPEPRVAFTSVPPGATAQTACGTPADDSVAFYCPADDTIYVGQTFAADLFSGVLRNLPGQQAGQGQAAGDFAVAYVLAHEYAHNLQQELGIFDDRPSGEAKPFELQADCLAGTWANSTYEQGILEPGDIEEGLETALAVGDFEVGTAQHHGTPPERRQALLTGFESGDPADCTQFLELA